MSDLQSIIVASLPGEDLSLQDWLQQLHHTGQLQRLIVQGVTQKLIATLARRHGLSATEQELQTAVDAWRSRVGLHRAEDTNRWLARHRLTGDDLEALVEQAVLRQKLKQHITRNAVAQHFAAHPGRFDRLRLAHLVVEKEDLAKELLSQIGEEGRDFAELARRYSLDEKTRLAGGNLGVVQRDRLAPTVAAALAEVTGSAVVGPVRTRAGYHLLRVEEFLPGQLDDSTRGIIAEELFQRWLQEQIQQANVVVRLYDYLAPREQPSESPVVPGQLSTAALATTAPSTLAPVLAGSS